MGALNCGPVLAAINERNEMLDMIDDENCNSLRATYQFARGAFVPDEKHSCYFRCYHHHSQANAAVPHLERSHSALLLLLGVKSGRALQL
jgi:hypothetical protein